MAYENDKRNRGVAFLIELFLPGGGSIYSDHFAGALLTWGLIVGGVVLVVTSIHSENSGTEYSSVKINETQLLVGVVAVLGGRIYGFVDAVSSVSTYNQKLRRSLGLPEWVSVGVTPIRTRDDVAYAPTLRVAF
jgi:hypothetical protein